MMIITIKMAPAAPPIAPNVTALLSKMKVEKNKIRINLGNPQRPLLRGIRVTCKPNDINIPSLFLAFLGDAVVTLLVFSLGLLCVFVVDVTIGNLFLVLE